LSGRDSISEIKRLVRQHDRLLQEIAANTRAARRTHAVDAPASILGTDEASDSIFDAFETKKKENNNSFETVVVNSKVYSTAFTGVLSPTSNDEYYDDARTIIDTESIRQPILPVHLERARSTEAHPGALLINAPGIQSSVLRLGIIRIYARCLVDNKSLSESELSFKRRQVIHSIRQLTKSVYYGQLEAEEKGTTRLWGHFDRKKVEIVYTLRCSLELRTRVACKKVSKEHHLEYDEGEMLKISVSLDVFHSGGLPLTRC
jgi:hypothetical protein